MSMDWGSVPAWVGTILTSGTLGLGFSILIKDRRDRKKDQAALVSAVWDASDNSVHIHNASKQAIYNLQVFPYVGNYILHSSKPPEFAKGGLVEWQGSVSHVKPESVEVFNPPLDRYQGRPSRVDLMFVDSRGVAWGRTALGRIASGYDAAAYVIFSERMPPIWWRLRKGFRNGFRRTRLRVVEDPKRSSKGKPI